MFKIISVAFLFCLTSTIANAEAFKASKPVVCDSTTSIVEYLTKNFEESPSWIGKDLKDETRYTLFINLKTGTWTLIQMNPEVACILGAGENSKFLGVGI